MALLQETKSYFNEREAEPSLDQYRQTTVADPVQPQPDQMATTQPISSPYAGSNQQVAVSDPIRADTTQATNTSSGTWDLQRMMDAGVDLSLYGDGDAVRQYEEQFGEPYTPPGATTQPVSNPYDGSIPYDDGGVPVPTSPDGTPIEPPIQVPPEPPPDGTYDGAGTEPPPQSGGISLDTLRESAPPVAGAGASEIGVPDAPTAVDATAAQTGNAAQAAASGAQASDATAGQAGTEGVGYNAQTGEVDPSTMTVAGQMNEITSQDSANMRRAREQGMLEAGRRGLQNSSFAAGMAQGAMVDRALPMAQQDAATYYGNMRANTDAINRALEVSSGRIAEIGVANAQMETQVALQNAGLDSQASMQLAELSTRVSQQNAEAQNRLTELQAQLDTAVSQQNADAANRIQQQMADIEAQINTRNAELQTQVSMANADAINRINQQVLDGNQQLNRQFLAGSQAQDLAVIQGRYQQLISSNAAASSIYNSYITAIGQAMANHDVTPDRIAQYINVMAQQLEGSLELIDAMNALDLGTINLPSARGSGDGSRSDVYPGTPGSIIPDTDDEGGGGTTTPPTRPPDDGGRILPGDERDPGGLYR